VYFYGDKTVLAQIASNQSSVFYDKFNETHSFSLLALGGLAGVVLVASGSSGGNSNPIANLIVGTIGANFKIIIKNNARVVSQ
jgi:hypothetical protein